MPRTRIARPRVAADCERISTRSSASIPDRFRDFAVQDHSGMSAHVLRDFVHELAPDIAAGRVLHAFAS